MTRSILATLFALLAGSLLAADPVTSPAVERIEVYSGGFPVRYGTRSGGVIDITPRTVSSGYENSLGASLIAYNASSVGRRAASSIASTSFGQIRRARPQTIMTFT